MDKSTLGGFIPAIVTPFAAAATDLAPNDAATLLQTMARVEADLETTPPATSLRADAEALLAATTAVLSVLDLDAPPCA